METWRHRCTETWTWRHEDMDMDGDMELIYQTKNGKQKPMPFSFICLVFAHRANGSLSFINFLTKKQTELSVCKRTKGTKWTCPSMHVSTYVYSTYLAVATKVCRPPNSWPLVGRTVGYRSLWQSGVSYY
jgi:hypothetical protein